MTAVRSVAPSARFRSTLFGQRSTELPTLGALADRMVKAKTVAEGDRLEAELVKGFFGDAKSST